MQNGVNLVVIIIEMMAVLLLTKLIYKGNSISKLVSILFIINCTLALNSIAGLTAYFIGGDRFTLMQVAISLVGYISILFAVYWCKGKKDVNNEVIVKPKWTSSDKYFLIFYIAVVLVLVCSTGLEFMPIWGNVDDANHYYFMNTIHQRLTLGDGWNNSFVVNAVDKALLPLEVERYSYLFGFHFMAALIARLLSVDTIYIFHILKCVAFTSFIVTPMLLLRRGEYSCKKIKVYIAMLFFSLGTCYTMLTTGYTAQLYAWALQISSIVFIKETIENKVDDRIIWYILIPLSLLSVMNAYILVGGLLLLWFIIVCIANKKYKESIISICYLGMLIPIPAIYNQIKNIFFTEQVTLDEALTVIYKEVPISIIVLCVLGGVICTQKIRKNKKKDVSLLYIMACSIFIIGTYVFLGKDNYTTYKTYLMSFPIILVGLAELIIYIYIIWTSKMRVIMGCAVVISIICMTNILSIDISQMKEIINAKSMIERGEYECVKYIIEEYNQEVPVVYIDSDGPTNFLIYSITRKKSMINAKDENVLTFVFQQTIQWEVLFDYMVENFNDIKESNDGKFVVISKNDFSNDPYFIKINNMLKSVSSVYEVDEWQVLELEVKSDIIMEEISSQMIYAQNPQDIVIEDIHRFGESILSSKKNEENIISIPEVVVSNNILNQMIFYGRCINDTKFIIELVDNDDVIYRQVVDYFNGKYIFDIPRNVDFNNIRVRIKLRDIRNSILIKKINMIYE